MNSTSWVLATGFRADRFMRPMEVIGRSGKRLDEIWPWTFDRFREDISEPNFTHYDLFD